MPLGNNLNMILFLLLVVICISIIIGLLYLILILIEFRKITKSINQIISASFGSSMDSLASIIARIDRISGLFLGKLDMVAEGSQKVKSYIKSFAKSPVVEIKSFLAGLRRGGEVLISKIFKKEA